MPHQTDRQPASVAELARLYFSDGMTLAAIGERCDMSHETVRNRLNAAGYTLRRRGAREGAISTAELARLYFEDGLPLPAVGERVGMSEAGVRHRLANAGYARRSVGDPNLSASTADLARLYFDDRLTLQAVAAKTGMSKAGVGRRLKTAGYTLRRSGPVNRSTSPNSGDCISTSIRP